VLSSSGCESRPAKAEPGRSVVSLAAAVVTSPLSRGQAAPKTACYREPQGSPPLKAAVVVTAIGRGDGAPDADRSAI
jgi:hypothetical protein